jgi:plastocyanin
MASAGPVATHSHTAHGRTGENPDLAPRRAAKVPKLVGIVNGNRDIEISDRTPTPGRYKIVVRDSTRSHNWHLYGNGKSVYTTVRGTGRWVFKIRLTAGSYRVVCDPHNDDMEFDLIVRR